MRRFETLTAPLGMVGVAAYLLHTLLGRLLWPEYDPVTTDISSLTAVGAPNRNLLMVFTTVYGVATILFIVGMIVKAFRKYHGAVRAGWIVFLVMQLVTLFGYSLFPLSGDKTQMTLGNLMHIVVTVVVVFTTITGSFLLAFGYGKQEAMKRVWKAVLIMAVVITAAGLLNPIGMANNWNIMGLTERAVIYALQLLMFGCSAYYTFAKAERV